MSFKVCTVLLNLVFKSEQKKTDEFKCLLGVRQGECLSPFLFAMYLNDIENTLKTNKFEGINMGLTRMLILLYADDAVILSDSRNNLQQGLTILNEYCTKWKITLNTDKTKNVVFRKGGKLSVKDKWYYDGKELEVVKHFIYLGAVFSSGGSFLEKQKTLAGQAQKAVFSLMKLLNKFDNVTHDIYCDLFDKMIMAILCYGSEVWGFHKGEAIERVYLQFCKRFLHLKYKTVNNIVYFILGRTNMQCVRYVRIVKYWLKIMKCNDTLFTKIVYNVLLCGAQNGKVNWVSRLKNLLETLGFGHVWLYQSVENDKLFFRIFNQRIRDNYGQRLHFELQNMSRGKYFMLYHKHFVVSKKLEIVKTESHRIALGGLRSSNHRLAIESGRWHKPHPTPAGERKCTCYVMILRMNITLFVFVNYINN